MLDAIRKEANKTYTENGAVTNISTYSDCLDLFSTIGALRKAPEKEIINRFIRAYTEDPGMAMKILFFARDVRGGLGERRVFRTIMKYLAEHKPGSVRKNIEYFAEYGRFDDLLALMDTACERDMLRYISKTLESDLNALEKGEGVSLLGKWLPSVNASNKDSVKNAKKIARYLGLSDAEYRKTVVKLRHRIRIIENDLRNKDYSFDYSKLTSKALFKYRLAFMRNDLERYTDFLKSTEKGISRMHGDTLMPYELVDPVLIPDRSGGTFMRSLNETEELSLNTSWASIPDYGDNSSILAVVDTSGSMYWGDHPYPASVALSLGIYFAERNKGLFHDHFMMFSETPKLIEIKGDKFSDKLRYIASFNEIGNTNLEAVFELLLSAAADHGITPEEMPSALYIISDMEFDRCVFNSDSTVYENAKRRFEEKGYAIPRVVFWNVASRNRQQPVTRHDQNTVLVSGCSPRLFSLLAGEEPDPYSFMISIINDPRYETISA